MESQRVTLDWGTNIFTFFKEDAKEKIIIVDIMISH